MNKYIKNVIWISLLLTGCDDFKFGNNLLEKPLSDEMNIDSVYSKKVYAEQALAQVYHSLPDFLPINNRLSWSMLETITDLAESVKSGGTEYHKGALTASNSSAGAYSMNYNEEHGECSATYGIRQAYIFLENIDRVPDMTAEEKRIRKGEAKMIIAYHYVDMLRNLGGMPWIDHAYKPEDDMKMERMTVEESVTKICSLIDEAAGMLPWEVNSMDDGRMTAAGALALKSRLLLFVASPLFNNDKPYREGEAADLRYVWYGNRSDTRWQDALNAGLEFMRENQRNGNVYQLVNTGNPRTDFCSGYFDRYNHEVLVASHRWIKWNKNFKSIAQIRFGIANPTLNYVDMFPMKNGEDFDWNNDAHRKCPFFNEKGEQVRDPRLYETLIVTGDKFRGRKAEIYYGGREEPVLWGSKNQNQGDWGGVISYTGVAVRKHIQDITTDLTNKFYQCPLLRLPEVYLNIAEAMNELGKATEKDEFGRDAYDYVQLVRDRLNMPGFDRTKVTPGKSLREAILRERALEFGYEEVRYYDINRWMHKDYLEVPLRRLEIYPLDPNDKNPVDKRLFRYEIKQGQMENKRVWVERWDNRYYLCPIPIDEINKKYGLVQNPGWE